jgi:hypothetical protein
VALMVEEKPSSGGFKLELLPFHNPISAGFDLNGLPDPHWPPGFHCESSYPNAPLWPGWRMTQITVPYWAVMPVWFFLWLAVLRWRIKRWRKQRHRGCRWELNLERRAGRA